MLSSVILIDLVTRMLGLVRSLINPKFLGVAAYGRLGVLSAILLFAAFCDLGMNREFELAYPHASDPKAAVGRAVRNYLLRAVFPVVILTSVIVYKFGVFIGAVCVPYLVTFGLTEIFMIVFRAEKKYAVINAYALGSAIVLTGAIVVVAPRFGFEGIATLQSAVGVFGALALAIAFLPIAARVAARAAPFDAPAPLQSATAFWLLLGQVLPLTWLTIDRLLLSGRIDPKEMGYWTLGGLPGGILAGLANTAASLHMAAWIRKERPYVTKPEALCFFIVTAAGIAVYGPFVSHFLREYSPGIPWNLKLIFAHVGVAILFFYDGYRRSAISEAPQARDWFIRKMTFTTLAFGLAWVMNQFFFHADPRQEVLCGFQLMLLLTWAFEKRWRIFLLQLALAGLSLKV